MVEKLRKYTKGINQYTKLNSILCTDFSVYKSIGKYIVKKYGGLDKLPIEFYIPSKNNVNYPSIAITLFTTILNEDLLFKIYGEPIYHDEFGEGFDGIYDKELDEYSEPDNKFSYASYFLNIKDIEYHIGYDHRGTNIEILSSGDTAPSFSKIVVSVIELIDIIFKNIKNTKEDE